LLKTGSIEEAQENNGERMRELTVDEGIEAKIMGYVKEGNDKPCILCGTMTKGREVTQTTDKEFGVVSGQVRFIIYVLCDNHPRTLLNVTTVEEAILQSFRDGGVGIVELNE